jgi:hypothetical protein
LYLCNLAEIKDISLALSLLQPWDPESGAKTTEQMVDGRGSTTDMNKVH